MKDLLAKLPDMYKAVAAFISLLVPFLTSVATSLDDGVITTQECTTIVVAGAAVIAGTRAVWQVKNKKGK